MKVAIFGSGRYYQLLKKYLVQCEIQFIVDNNKQKQGTQIDGLNVYALEKADFSACDYIVILVEKYYKVMEQLICFVSLDKIVPYTQIGSLLEITLNVNAGDEKLSLQEWVKNKKRPKIMIISNDLSRSGVPIALMNLAILLRKMNYSVIYVSILHGDLGQELLDRRINYVDGLAIFMNDPQFFDIAKEFDLFVAGSAVLSNIVQRISYLKKPVMWWFHESMLPYYGKREKPIDHFNNIYYYAGGKRVVRALENYFCVEKVQELLYYLPEEVHIEYRDHKSEKVIFALIGAFLDRKAQDILGDASNLISSTYKDKYEVIFVGAMREYEKEYYKTIKEKYSNIKVLNEMKSDELKKIYETIDVLVCPSRDDPMPIVVTEAMEYGIPCIVSDQVGQEEFIENGVNGFVFENENVPMLAGIMEWIMEHPLQLSEIGKNGRKIFDDHFSEEHMRARMTEILKQYSII